MPEALEKIMAIPCNVLLSVYLAIAFLFAPMLTHAQVPS